MHRRNRFDARRTAWRLNAIERGVTRQLRRVNTRIFLWFLEHAQAGVAPHVLPGWMADLTAKVIRDLHRRAFALGWEGADRETRLAHKERAAQFAVAAPTKPGKSLDARKIGNWIEISMPEAKGHPTMAAFLVGGVLQSDGTYVYPYPYQGPNWYSEQALRLAATSDQAKLDAVRDVIQAGIENQISQTEMANQVAAALRPFGLPGGLGSETGPPGVAGAMQKAADLPQWQVDRIVRTETMQVYNAGRYLRQVGEELITGWEWSAVLDDVCCEECEERDGLFIPKGEEDGESPPYHPNCLLPGTSCVPAGEIIAGMRAFYSGPIVKFFVEPGDFLSITANHLFLTPDGWVRADSLRKGDYVFYCTGFDRVFGVQPENDKMPTLVEEIFSSLLVTRGMGPMSMPPSAEDFHGDGCNVQGDIEIVPSNRFLRSAGVAAGEEGTGQCDLTRTRARVPLIEPGDFAAMFVRLARAADRIMGGRREALAFKRRSLAHSEKHGFAPIADVNAGLLQAEADDDSFDTKGLAESLLRFASEITPDDFGAVHVKSPVGRVTTTTDRKTESPKTVDDRVATATKGYGDLSARLASLITPRKVLSIERDWYSGHVYDLQTTSSLYIANGILSSNCRCVLLPVLDFEEPPDKSLEDLPESAQMPDGWGDPLRREWTAGEE
jgi:hypothetical protein